ncbi:HlyD family secretion protein [Brevibacillus reuszeri]|uniref:HlyD family secretion protein n=1 Tax=Brevibacillus reuszeri TaxID=54915 RepID=UPI001BB3CA75|nr:efflux RND transporter periplasmic adaptor subunit [Brevibacillus reuszeri]
MMKTQSMKVIVGVGIAALLLSGCGSVQPVELRVASAQGSTSPPSEKNARVFTGKMVGIEEVTIYAKAAGRVASVHYDIGDRVEGNAVLFDLEKTELEASLQMAKADLAQAKAKWEEAKKGSRPEEIKYAEAGWQQAINKYQDVKNGKRPEELVQLQAALESANTAYELSTAKKERTQVLFSQGAVSEQALEDAQAAVAQAEAQYKRSEEELALAKAGVTKPALQALQANVEQMKALYDKAKNGFTPEQLAQFEADMQKAEAAVSNAEYQLKNAAVISPLKGYVSTKNIHAGEMVNTSLPAMTVVNTDQMYVVIGVSEADITRFTVDEQVDVTVPATHDHLRGKVARISPKADAGTNTFTVKILLDNAKGLLRSGMTGEVQL